MGSGVAVARAYCKGACCKGVYYKRAYCEGAYHKGACRKKGGIGGRVGIGGRAGIGASFGKDLFRLFRVPLLLYRALYIVYSGGVGK